MSQDTRIPTWLTTPITRPGPSAVTYHIPSSLSPSLFPSFPSDPPNPSSYDSYPPPHTRIHLPRSSHWTSGLHFHATHTEYLHLIQGAIHVYLDGRDLILSAAASGLFDPETGRVEKLDALLLEIPRYARHDWGRAESYLRLLDKKTKEKEKDHVRGKGKGTGKVYMPEDMDDEVVVEEYTAPGDLGKPLFFWNLNAVLTTHLPLLSSPVRRWLGLEYLITIQLYTIFWALDNFPIVLSLHGILAPIFGTWAGGMVERGVEYIVSLAWVRIVSLLGWALGMRAVVKERIPEGLEEVRHREVRDRFYASKGRA